jgi:hypothetical protein
MINIAIPTDAEAYDLQRQYAGHVFLLRGYVRNTAYLEEPGKDTFEMTNWVLKEGQSTQVVGDFPSPPLAAYVDNVPMTVRTSHNPLANRVTISLVAPSGTRGGPVRLVWPSKILVSERPLWIASEHLDMRQREATVGGDLFIGMFPERPQEVHVGWKEVPQNDILWENGVLQVRVPTGAGHGPVLVVTQGRVYLGRELFNLLPKKKADA